MKPSINQNLLYLSLVLFGFLFGNSAQAQVYLYENFNGNSLPSGWTNTNQGSGSCQWMIHSPFSPTGDQINMNGSNFLFVNSDSAGAGTVANELFSSPLILASSGQAVFLEFQHYYKAGGSLRLDTGSVEVFNGTNWVRVSRYFTNQGTGNNPSFVKIDISTHVNPALRVRFRYVGNYAYYWAVDNVKVYTPPANDLGVVAFNFLANECGIPSTFPVSVKVVNFGSVMQTNFSLAYRVNNNPPVSQTFNGQINPGDSVNITFTEPFVSTVPGTYLFSSWTNLNGDADLTNDTLKNKAFQRNASGFNTLSFTGFTGANLSTLFPGWNEATGNIPTGTTSSWLNNAAAQQTGFGTTTAKVNLYAATKKEWIISPAVNPTAESALRYKVALTNWNTMATDSMGSDDSLIVKISTNCGLTWSNLKVYTRLNPPTNQLVQEVVPLAAYAGQTVKIGFYATEGTVNDLPDYDVHIDDPEIFVQSPNDLALTAINNLNLTCGLPASLSLQVQLLNNGTQTQNSIPLNYSVNGGTAVTETFTQTLAPGQSAMLTFSTPIPFPNPGTYQISAWTSLGTDQNLQNDSLKNISAQRYGPGFNPVEFTGFTGANLATVYPEWQEAATLNATGTTSSWTSSSAAQTTAFGTTTARVNLLGNTKRDWIISQPVVPTANSIVRFKLAVTNGGTAASDGMGSDDSLVIKVSTNCGQTWTRVKAFTKDDNLTNSLTYYIAPLSQFAGQPIRIGFLATDGTVNDPEDYDLHIDAIEVYVPSPNDLGIQSILLPDLTCGVGSNLNLKVRVFNNGTLNQATIPLSYSVNGQTPVNETFPLALASGESGEFTFSTPISFSTPGNYSISAWTNLSGDQNNQNDTIRNIAVNRPGPNLNQVTFTGFTGANLGVAFPGWKEATGLNGNVGTTSAWLNSITAQTNGLGSATARVNLFTNTKKEWMISPAIVPSAGYVIKLKIAVTAFGGIGPATMGSDDSLIVKISSNCGQTWSRARSWTASSNLTNQLTSYEVPLSDYAGQNILIGLYATDGSTDNIQDYDIHVDDIQLILPIPNDVGISNVIFPGGNCGAPASFNLAVSVTNYGSLPQSNIPVFYSMNGQTPVEGTITGPLAAGQNTTFTFPNSIDLTAPGLYTFNAWTGLAGDENNLNDSLVNQTISRPDNYLVQIDFNSFDGTNLENLYPGWKEATGHGGTFNSSTWVYSSGTQTNAFQTRTAKINLNGNTKRDWIVSPVFIPQATTNLVFKIAVTSRNFDLPAVMGSDDSLNVMVSTNCGQSWLRIKEFTVSNNLTNQLTSFSVPIGAYANQPVLVGFKASEGDINNTQDYDLHLDDIFASINTSQRETETIEPGIFPNPATDWLTIQLPQATNSGDFLQFFGMDGRELTNPVELKEGLNTHQVNLTFLPEGLYVVKIHTGNRILVKTIMHNR